MKLGLSEIVVILDSSGSMQRTKVDMLGAYNEFLAKQKKAPGEANYTLVQFSGGYKTIYDRINIKDAPELTDATYKIYGSTAMYDAIGSTIDKVGVRLSETKEEDRPEHVIFVILTDGEENSSKEYTADQVKALLKTQEDTWKWSFIYLGANQDAFAMGSRIGANASFTANYGQDALGYANLFTNTSSAVSSLRSGNIGEAKMHITQQNLDHRLAGIA